MRRAAKRDFLEPAIVETLRARGWFVELLNLKDGPDLLISKLGECNLVEVKTGNKKLKPGQADWHARWTGPPVVILRTIDDALAL